MSLSGVEAVIICHCMHVCDRTIRELACKGARTGEEIAEACGAGACCGGCRPAIDEILQEEQPGPPIVFLRVTSSAA